MYTFRSTFNYINLFIFNDNYNDSVFFLVCIRFCDFYFASFVFVWLVGHFIHNARACFSSLYVTLFITRYLSQRLVHDILYVCNKYQSPLKTINSPWIYIYAAIHFWIYARNKNNPNNRYIRLYNTIRCILYRKLESKFPIFSIFLGV